MGERYSVHDKGLPRSPRTLALGGSSPKTIISIAAVSGVPYWHLLEFFFGGSVIVLEDQRLETHCQLTSLLNTLVFIIFIIIFSSSNITSTSTTISILYGS